jgi:hypothetical protein
VVSAPIDLEGKPARIALNVDGISPNSSLSVAVLSERLEPVPGYTPDACIAPTASGLDQAISWTGHDNVKSENGPIRLRINFRESDWKMFDSTLYT